MPFSSKAAARTTNRLLLALAASLYLSFIAVAFLQRTSPYDYWLIARGAQKFCFQGDTFQYGTAQDIYYPAPLYASLCGPLQVAPQIVQAVWLLAPFLMVLWLSRGKVGVLLFLPFADHMLLGQSTWLVLPLYIIAAQPRSNRAPPLWYGLLLPLAIIKPHVAFAAVVVLLYRWRKYPRLLAVIGVSSLLFCLPAFLMRPTWLLEWLASPRGLAKSLSVTSLAHFPFRLGIDSMAIIAPFCLAVGMIAYIALRRRRGKLELYDWVLLFCLSNPLMMNYDLIILLPFIMQRRRRLWLATAIGGWAWIVGLSLMVPERDFNPFGVSVIIVIVLLLGRLLPLSRHEYAGSVTGAESQPEREGWPTPSPTSPRR